MCNFQTLYLDEQIGYVVRCRGCDKIQLGFANLMLTFETGQFAAFRVCVQQTLADQPASLNPAMRCIAIPTNCESVGLLLSKCELEELDSLLDKADSELQSLDLISLFDAEE